MRDGPKGKGRVSGTARSSQHDSHRGVAPPATQRGTVSGTTEANYPISYVVEPDIAPACLHPAHPAQAPQDVAFFYTHLTPPTNREVTSTGVSHTVD